MFEKQVKESELELSIPIAQLHPLILAYEGDAFFSLYVRTKLLFYEHNKVRIMHEFGAKIVSAAMQALALKSIEEELDSVEQAVVRRGRNAKSTVPKSATVSEYRYSTGFEALLGYLYLSGNTERLMQLSDQAFLCIMAHLEKVKL